MDPDEDSTTAGDEHCTRLTFLRSTTTGVAGVLALDLGWPVDAAAAALPSRLEPAALAGGCAPALSAFEYLER